MGQAGRSQRTLPAGAQPRMIVAAILIGAVVALGTVVGEHLFRGAPAGLLLLLLVELGIGLGVLALSEGPELVAVGVCAVPPIRPGRARLRTVPRGRARLVPNRR
jgi:hypothetical protein